MSGPREWTPAEEAAIRDHHAAGRSLTWIARELDITKPVLSRKAAKMGLAWDRSRTVKATEAHVADARGRRALLQVRLLDDAEKLRDQLWKPTLAFNFGGKDNTYAEHQLDEPTFADKLKLMQAVGIAVDRSLKLDLHDSAAGAAQVVGLLQQTAAALGLADADDTTP